MSRIKKVAIILLFALVIMINIAPCSKTFYNTRNKNDISGNSYQGWAYINPQILKEQINTLGMTGLDYQIYLDTPNFLCLQHGQKLNSGWLTGKYKTYYLKAKLTIEGCYSELSTYNVTDKGNNSTITEKKWGQIKSVQNAKLASILGETLEEYEYTDASQTKKVDDEKKTIINNNNKRYGSNGRDRSPMQHIIWQYMPTYWSKIKTISNNKYAGSGLGDLIGNSSAETDMKEAKDMMARAEEYANSIKDQTSSSSGNVFKDLTDYTKITAKKVGTDQLLVGPFRWSFEGKIENTTVYRDDGSSGVKKETYRVYEGTKLVTKNFNTLTTEEAEKGFYIQIKNVGDIKKIQINKKSDVKKATIWFLDTKDAQWQNLIYFEPVSETEINNYNINLTGKLNINKIDGETKEPLSGVGFKIKQLSTGKYVNQFIREDKKYISYVSEEEATEFITTSNGTITISDLTQGEYEIIETKNPDTRYKVSTQPTKVKVIKGKTNKVTIENIKEEVPEPIDPDKPIISEPVEGSLVISGYVWKDYINDGKTSTRDNLYIAGSQDKMIANGEVEVTLYYGNGKMLEETTNRIQTDNGRYSFNIKFPDPPEKPTLEEEIWPGNKPVMKEIPDSVTDEEERNKLYKQYRDEYDAAVKIYNQKVIAYNNAVARNRVLIEKYNEEVKEYEEEKAKLEEKIKQSYIEFKYDALIYKDVDTNLQATNGSKAAEASQDRNAINQRFYSVEGSGGNKGITRNSQNQKELDLTYTKVDYKSIDVQVSPTQMISASTKNAGYSIGSRYTSGVKEINNINLGLYEREQPDLAIATDVQDVQIKANNKEHTYEYAKRFNIDNQNAIFGLSWKKEYADAPEEYNRPIYSADVRAVEDGKNFEVYVIYHIAMKNQATNLKSTVNSIINYYDEDYEVVEIGTDYNKNSHEITGTKLTWQPEGMFEGYNKMIVETNLSSEAKDITNVYIKYKLGDQAIKRAVDSQNGELFYNISEINSYSTRDSNGAIYAGIDSDSNPGNTIPGQGPVTYEDDTDEAVPFRISKANSRTMTGNVFLDALTEEKDVNGVKERIYDGEYQEDTDKPLKNVKVMLIEDKENGNVVSSDITNENGEFTLTDYPAGDYKLSYQWGVTTGEVGTSYTENNNEVKINVQNYKATVYKDKDRQTDSKWYLTTEPRYSDALDSIETRENIDEEIAIIEANEKYIVDENGTITPNFEKFENKQMTSTTPGTMDIGIENQESNYTEDGTLKQTYEIKNADFGIAERPKQDLDLEKEVSYVKITLDNALTLIETGISDGKIEGEVKSLAYQGPQENAEGTTEDVGFVKAEIDKEISHSINLQATYKITVKNDSELDYQSTDYYHYGEKPDISQDKTIGMIPSDILDYVDSGWSIESINDEESGWKEYTGNSSTQSEGNTKTISNQTMSTQELKPTNSASIYIKVSKEVAVGQQEFNIGNKAQIIKIERPTSSTPETPNIKGRIPEALSSAEAEEIIVTPNTGANRNITLQIMIATLSLATIMGGIILIKKKVLGK